MFKKTILILRKISLINLNNKFLIYAYSNKKQVYNMF